jgi:hypothetical protein
MNEKVKIFSDAAGSNFNDLEAQINNWLESKQEIKIVARNTFSCSGIDNFKLPYINCTVCIFYLDI